MKTNGKLYRNVFIIIIVLVIIITFAFKYFPFSKILRIKGNKELSFSKPEKTGCEPPNSILFDFEVAPGKDIPNGIIVGNSHSGKYAAKAYGKNSFTPALERTAGELGLLKLKYISVSAWVFVKPGSDQVNAALVVAASNNMGVNICWKGVGLKDPGVPRGKWFKMSGHFDLSDVKFNNDTRLQMYFWNNSSADILVDDFYLVYGGPQPRKGDTTYVDLTKGQYQPKFNYPPFPVVCLRMAGISDIQAAGLTAGSGKDKGIILPSDPMISGAFITGNDGNDVMFAVSNGQPAIYSYCPGSNEFRKAPVELPVALPFDAGKQYLLKGKFSSRETEQLLYIGNRSCFLFHFISKGPACSESNSITAELLWQSQRFDTVPFNSESPLLTADFNGDGLCEVLAADSEGKWKLYRFEPGKGKAGGSWLAIAEDRDEMPDWKQSGGLLHLTTGHFFTGRVQAAVLAVKQNSKDRRCSYSLRMYNLSQKRFVSCFSEKYGINGRTIGIDTLKPGDRFFCGNFGANGSPMVLRYNRDWRYDMKEICFSDSTYHILNNVDFAGYAADHNPKYYEVLKIIPGRFTGHQCSIIVIGRNSRNRDYDGKDCSDYENLPELPDFISVYSFVSR